MIVTDDGRLDKSRDQRTPTSSASATYNRSLKGCQQLKLLVRARQLVIVWREPAENAQAFLDALGVVPSVDVAEERRLRLCSCDEEVVPLPSSTSHRYRRIGGPHQAGQPR